MISQNLKTMQYKDSIFFSEKHLNLCAKRLSQTNPSINQEALNDMILADQEAEAKKDERKAGSPPNQVGHRFLPENLSSVELYFYEFYFAKAQFDQSVFDMAYCFVMNKEYMRCINLIEKHDLVFRHHKFRNLCAQAQIYSGSILEAIQTLETKIQEQDVWRLDGASSGSEEAGASSGFAIGGGSSSNHSNLNDLVDDIVEGQESGNLLGHRGLRRSLKAKFHYDIRDPFEVIEFEFYLSSNPDSASDESKRYLLLGGAYEQQENKINAVNNYKMALRVNPECY